MAAPIIAATMIKKTLTHLHIALRPADTSQLQIKETSY